MSELLNGIFECLDISSSTGLASEDSLLKHESFSTAFYTQAHEKIGIDAVYFLLRYKRGCETPLSIFLLSRNIMQRKLQNCIVFHGISERLRCYS